MPVAATTAATAAAIQAQRAADEARTARCLIEMGNYDARHATVPQMQSYAACVRHVHPDNLSPDAVIAVKLAIVIVLVCVVIGAVSGATSYAGGRLEVVMMHALGGFLIGCVLDGFILALMFLFS